MYYCLQCGGTPDRLKTRTRGSFRMEVFLWFILIIPGLIYSMWRLTSKAKVCPVCSSESVIPASSPIAVEALKNRAKEVTPPAASP